MTGGTPGKGVVALKLASSFHALSGRATQVKAGPTAQSPRLIYINRPCIQGSRKRADHVHIAEPRPQP